MTTTSHPSTSLDLPNIIAKLALQSTSKVNMDGSTTFKFEGRISSQSLHLVYLAAELQSDDGFIHETKQSIIYNGNGKDYTWNLRQTKVTTKAEKFQVIFTLNDYTHQGSSHEFLKAFQDANEWLEFVILHPEQWRDYQAAIDGAARYVINCARDLANL